MSKGIVGAKQMEILNNKIMFSDDQFENAINVCPLCVSYTLKTENIKKQTSTDSIEKAFVKIVKGAQK